MTSLARYLRATGNRFTSLGKCSDCNTPRLSQPVPGADGPPATRKTFDILTFERRGEDFALVRIRADGSRSEIFLTAANVVHLGLLAPGFARQVLTDKVGQKPGAVATFVRHTAMNANLRFIEIMLTILERGGGRFDFPTTERRARALGLEVGGTGRQDRQLPCASPPRSCARDLPAECSCNLRSWSPPPVTTCQENYDRLLLLAYGGRHCRRGMRTECVRNRVGVVVQG